MSEIWSQTLKFNIKHSCSAAPSVPLNVHGTFTHAVGVNRPRIQITWDQPSEKNGIISKYIVVYYYYNKDTPNNKTVIVKRESTLMTLTYTVVVTFSGTFSFKISAFTVVQGPFSTEKNITIPEYSKLSFICWLVWSSIILYTLSCNNLKHIIGETMWLCANCPYFQAAQKNP